MKIQNTIGKRIHMHMRNQDPSGCNMMQPTISVVSDGTRRTIYSITSPIGKPLVFRNQCHSNHNHCHTGISEHQPSYEYCTYNLHLGFLFGPKARMELHLLSIFRYLRTLQCKYGRSNVPVDYILKLYRFHIYD